MAGGGSGGSVSPLIAVAEAIRQKHSNATFLLVGTAKGPERLMAEKARIDFCSIVAGKFRRYWSWKNFLAPFLTFFGLIQAFIILRSFKPDCIFGAGSFIQVPVIWASWLLRIPSVIHQQDVVVSLANRLCEPFVKKITVCFEKSLADFSRSSGFFYKRPKSEKIILTGNPFRQELKKMTREQALINQGLRPDLPVLLVLGGGTGSNFINQLVIGALPELSLVVQIVHSWGIRNPKKVTYTNYHPYDFISDMASAYAAADIVVSRAGLSTLTELANLEKVSIVIPMPGTHQEYNAFLLETLRAALIIRQSEVTPAFLTRVIKKMLFDYATQQALKANIAKIMPKNSAKKIAEVIVDIVR